MILKIKRNDKPAQKNNAKSRLSIFYVRQIMNFSPHLATSLPTLSIAPGDFLVTRTPNILRTLLGSCVSACLFDPKQKIAGMNHFLLPHSPTPPHPSIFGRYASSALPLLLSEMEKKGARRQDLRASIFGGGEVISALEITQVGAQNAQAARDFFRQQGIALHNQHLGGKRPRRLYFDTQSGQIKLEWLPHTENSAREHDPIQSLDVLYFQA